MSDRYIVASADLSSWEILFDSLPLPLYYSRTHQNTHDLIRLHRGTCFLAILSYIGRSSIDASHEADRLGIPFHQYMVDPRCNTAADLVLRVIAEQLPVQHVIITTTYEEHEIGLDRVYRELPPTMTCTYVSKRRLGEDLPPMIEKLIATLKVDP